MCQETDFIKNTQCYVIKIAIGGSTLRNQGSKGVMAAAIKYLSVLDLSPLKSMEPVDYLKWLDEKTSELKEIFPEGAKNWGTARKAINVFMVQVFFNKYLAGCYKLDKFKDVLETPLDSYAARNLRRYAGRGKLPRWESIINLKPASSSKYQEYASIYAQEKNMPRACLDIILWRSK